MVALPKPRPPRTRRIPSVPLYAQAEESMAWAISYADVLMVLLSFFVIFFSLSPSETNSVLKKILASQPGSLQRSESKTQSQTIETAGRGSVPHDSLLAEIAGLGLDHRLIKRVEADAVNLLLPDNSYGPGRLKLVDTSDTVFQDTLRKMLPYKDQVLITFVGHSDKQSIVATKSELIHTNFDLSVLRATRAIEEAVSAGFDLEGLRAGGQSYLDRDSRSLSIQVSLRGKI